MSKYFKIKTDHNGHFYKKVISKKLPVRKGFEIHQFIKHNKATFEDYFLAYHHSSVITLEKFDATLQKMDFIIRYEHLQEDFKVLCSHLKMSYQPIPKLNITSERDKDYLKYYTSSIIPLAISKYQKTMTKWGYQTPKEWAII